MFRLEKKKGPVFPVAIAPGATASVANVLAHVGLKKTPTLLSNTGPLVPDSLRSGAGEPTRTLEDPSSKRHAVLRSQM
jgi:hypothetical protein